MPAYLTVIAGLPPQVLTLDPGVTTVGRSPSAGIELQHLEISRRHCRFAWDGTTCTVEDLGSARGTSVNGSRISTVTRLNSGDQVALGPVVLEFSPTQPPPPLHSAVETRQPLAASKMLVRGETSERIIVEQEVIIGRDPNADVFLNDPGVSRRHASLRPLSSGGILVADLHSTAGSFVNGHRFDEHELTVGDRLQVGPFCFQFDGQALVRVANSSGGTIEARSIMMRCGPQVILDDLSVTIPPSRFVGIIGPSGAGKSSLLHTLSGLRPPEGGLVLADGTNVYDAETTQSFGFVPQEDIVHPELTVAEALRFSARLRLPRGTPDVELQKLILQTLDQLGLRERAGLPIARLSGGQRKRVSVGVELLAKPSILFLDEPSSGLDPATEFQLMELLRDLADTGCTIICTTHIMENAYLLDQLIVLVGGCLAFQGSPQEARDYFRVNKLTGLYDRLADRPALEWRSAFAETAHPEQHQPLIASNAATTPVRRASALAVLLHRQWAILRSDWRNFLILLGQPLIIAALVCWVSDARDLVMFFAYLATLWFGCSNAAQEVVKEIAIYRRERLIGVRTRAYLTSKFLFLTAITSLQALLLYGAVLIGEGGRDGSVAWQIGGLLGTALAAVGIGLLISALARTVMQAVMIVPLILIPQIIFSGFTVPAHEMTAPVMRISQFMPTFAAQRVMDTSFLWMRQLTGDVISDHSQSYRNLDPDRDFSSQDVYNRARPAWLALATHIAWAVLTYVGAWLALRRRERTG
ncbi:MAG TPA: FHA domain-containing protein [Chthoniobacteraceae bacterium]|jgi:ABC-type multidrug transport system ATPase subunit/pSer/pThr/pTyr-binding forkhead associated (FHA) protein